MQLTEEIAQKVFDGISQTWWRPRDRTLAAILRRKDDEDNRRLVRWGMAAAVLSYITYGVFDWFLFPDIAERLIIGRVILGLTFLTLLEICARRGATLLTLHVIAALAIVCGAIGWLLAALPTSQQSALATFLAFGTVFILGANLFFNFSLWLSAVTSVTVALAFCYAILFSLQASIETRAVLFAYFANCLAFSLYLSWRFARERYRAFLHALKAQIQEQIAIEKGQKLIEIADTDPLTGLKNRRAIVREFTTLNHNGGERTGIILIDVDHFKEFNDRFGHQAGDECLVVLARTFSDYAKANDAIAGRYGGEEFIILCKSNGIDHLRRLAADLCDAVEQLQIAHPRRSDSRKVVTISVGACLTGNKRSTDLPVLLQEADRALYASKSSGRGTYTVVDLPAYPQDHDSEDQTRPFDDVDLLVKVAG